MPADSGDTGRCFRVKAVSDSGTSRSAFAPDLSYADLAIADGETAPLMYLKDLKREAMEDDRKRVYAGLLDYCCLGTLAELRLLEEL